MENLYPYYCAHLINVEDNLLKFRTYDNEITMEYNKEIIFKIISSCNGIYSYNIVAENIAKDIKKDIDYIKAIIDDLYSLNILTDSKKQMKIVHSLTNNPSLYYQHLNNNKVIQLQNNHPNYMLPSKNIIKYKNVEESHFMKLLRKRYSCRNFSDKVISTEKLFEICKSAYSSEVKPVASAGNLTPLSIFLIVINGNKNMPRGVYQYNNDTGNLNQIRTDITNEELIFAFNDENIIFGAPCIFVITADINRHMQKYANRGYRFTLLEVGHVLQNITIESIEQGLNSIEYGGFKDMTVAKLLGLSENLLPIACTAVGYSSSNEQQNNNENLKIELDNIEEQLINKLGIIDEMVTVKNDEIEDSWLNVVVSHYKKAEPKALRDNDRYGTGISNTFFNAAIKSIMEAYERYICGKFYYDEYKSLNEIDCKFIDPKIYCPYSEELIKRNNLSTINNNDKLFLIKGFDNNNNPVLIPVDLCFFPISVENLGRNVFHYANSSGCAAHFDLEKAKQSAIEELIERDALMKIWILKKSPYKIENSTLSLNIQRRIEKYEKKGFSIYVLLLSNTYAYTILTCAIRKDDYPYFVSGASTSFDSVNEAIEKAFNEMEYSIIAYTERVKNNEINIIEPKEVGTPVEHGDLYAYSRQQDNIEFLCKGEIIDLKDIKIEKKNKLEELNLSFMEYRPIVKNIHVVRAFSSELIPINFGYDSDFYCHKNIKEKVKQYNKFPHFFA